MSAAEALSQARACLREGRLGQAESLYRGVLHALPGNHEALHGLGVVACQQGRFEDGIDLISSAFDISGAPHYLLSLALAHQDRNDPDQAERTLRLAIQLQPGLAQAHYNLGELLRLRGGREEAALAYAEAIRCRRDYPAAWQNLALLQLRLDRPAEALLSARELLALRPESPEGWYLTATALQRLERLGEAANHFAQACSRRPNELSWLLAHAETLDHLGRLGEARQAYLRARRLSGANAEIANALGNVLANMGRPEEAAACLEEAARLAPADEKIFANWLVALNGLPGLAPQTVFEAHREWARRFTSEMESRSLARRDAGGGRLRVGYVSPALTAGAVGAFLRPVLERHDAGRFEVYCYADSASEDAVSLDLRALAAHWRQVSRLNDVELTELIRADAIDVLVDLAGHTPGNRLVAFARRAAPVQVSWLDYFNTTALPEMDFLVSDPVSTPPEAERLFTERIVRMPASRLCYAAPGYAPAVSRPPCLRNGYVTFGSFNRQAKLNRSVLRLWARAMAAIPGSRMVLKNTSLDDVETRRGLAELFATEGVDPERLDMRGPSGHERMLAEYADLDLALDPFPYTGGLTTCEALWMGVPVITLAGDSMIARQGASLLNAAGCPEFIARDADGYAALMARWAALPDVLRELRARLRKQVAESPLCDAGAFTSALENAYVEMLRVASESR